MHDLQLDRQSVFHNALSSIVKGISPKAATLPKLYGPNGRLLPPSNLSKTSAIDFQKRNASRKGTLRTWIPRKIDKSQAAMEREMIAERATDLVNEDPNAAGVLDAFAYTVIGPALLPHPTIDGEALGLTNEQATRIENRFKYVFKKWSAFADAGERMSFGGLCFLAVRQLIQFGEFFFTLPMIDDANRPYMLALQPVHPLRVKTPIELINQDNVRDGIQLNKFGAADAVFIKKAVNTSYSFDTLANFTKINRKAGHRYKLIHAFQCKDPEQTRGISAFSPALKMFRDLSDYLDAELVSNIVTAAFSVWIETGANLPSTVAENWANISETAYKSDGSTYEERYEEIEPGAIYYGQNGQRPHVISAQRPGATFQPFVQLILKSVASAVGVPHPVLFRDFQGMNYASYRSAMLEAWRTFMTFRKFIGSSLANPVYKMLIEESYLKGELDDLQLGGDFYDRYFDLLDTEWIGPPKGQIEPVKEIQAEILAVDAKLKSRQEVSLEYGRDFNQVVKKLAEEKQLLEDNDLATDPAEMELDQTTDENEGDQNGTN